MLQLSVISLLLVAGAIKKKRKRKKKDGGVVVKAMEKPLERGVLRVVSTRCDRAGGRKG